MSNNMIPLTQLPDNLIKNIIEKDYNLGHVPFRKCCRYLDSFVERHRDEFSKRSSLWISLSLEFVNNDLRVRYAHHIFEQPNEQLSAFCIEYLHFKFPEDEKHKAEYLAKVLSFVKTMRLSVKDIHISSDCLPSEEELSFLSHVNYRQIDFSLTETISFSQFFSLTSVQGAKELIIQGPLWDEFPIKRALQLTLQYEYLHISFTATQNSFAFNYLRHLVNELAENKISSPIPTIRFVCYADVNIESYIPGMQLIWRNASSKNTYPRRIYAIALPSSIFILNQYENKWEPRPAYQEFNVSFIEKSVSALEKFIASYDCLEITPKKTIRHSFDAILSH